MAYCHRSFMARDTTEKTLKKSKDAQKKFSIVAKMSRAMRDYC